MDSIANKIPDVSSGDLTAMVNGGGLIWLVIVISLVCLCGGTLWLLREIIFRAAEEREEARKDQNVLMRATVRTLEKVASVIEKRTRKD